MTLARLSGVTAPVRALASLLLASAPLAPGAALAQAVPAGGQLPPKDVALADLRLESKQHEIFVEKPRRLNVSTGIQDNLSRAEKYRRVYALRLQPGQALQIDLSSDDVDTLLRAYDDSGNLVAENDDGADNTNSRLFLAGTDKAHLRYFIVATATQLRAGRIDLELRERESPRPPRQMTLAMDSPVTGKLDPTSPLSIADQVVYDTYFFDGSQGDRISVVATPVDAPVGLQLKVGTVKPFQANTNVSARPVTIFGPLKQGGQVEVRVTGSPAATSPYKLELTRLPPENVTVGPVPIQIGQEISGSFGPGTPLTVEQNRPYALYVLDGRAGQAVNVTAQMDGAPSKVEFGGPIAVEVGVDSPMGFVTIPQSRFRRPFARNAKFQHDGPMLIRVSGVSGTTGAFKLRIEQAAPADEQTLRSAQ